MYEKSDKDYLAMILLCFFLGSLGVHRFYAGKVDTKSYNEDIIDFSYDENGRLSRIEDNVGGDPVEYFYLGNRLHRTTINDQLAKIYVYGPSGALLYTEDHFDFFVQTCDISGFNNAGNTLSLQSDGVTRAVFDDQGYLKLTGQIHTTSDMSSVSSAAFEVLGTGGVRVAVIDDAGNLHTVGEIDEFVADLVGADNNNFIITRENTDVFVVTGAGAVQLRGCAAPLQVI